MVDYVKLTTPLPTNPTPHPSSTRTLSSWVSIIGAVCVFACLIGSALFAVVTTGDVANFEAPTDTKPVNKFALGLSTTTIMSPRTYQHSQAITFPPRAPATRLSTATAATTHEATTHEATTYEDQAHIVIPDFPFLAGEGKELLNVKVDSTNVWEIAHTLSGRLEGESLVYALTLSPLSPLHQSLGQLRQGGMEYTLARILSSALASPMLASRESLETLFVEYLNLVDVRVGIVSDLIKMIKVDPAVDGVLHPFLFFKGYHALQAYRVSNVLWNQGDHATALFLQSRISEVYGVDIHPAAKIGTGVMLDHANSITIGSTAIVGNDCYILHGVTLGATGKSGPDSAKRHPTIGSGVKIGAHATVLGDIHIGDGATIAASAIVTKPVGSGQTVVGTNSILQRRIKPGENRDTWFYTI